jgi:hypothetical protein
MFPATKLLRFQVEHHSQKRIQLFDRCFVILKKMPSGAVIAYQVNTLSTQIFLFGEMQRIFSKAQRGEG